MFTVRTKIQLSAIEKIFCLAAIISAKRVEGRPCSLRSELCFGRLPALEIKKEELDLAGTDIVIGGHSGIPDGQAIGDGFWLNAGAIGFPANDGTLDGWYLLLCPEQEAIACRWQRLAYPAARTAEVMRSRGFVGGYTDALWTGLWPSMDVLPEAQRQLRGQPIKMNKLICC